MLKKTTHTELIILIDPDKYNPDLIELANRCRVSYIFVGGSKLKQNNFDRTIKSIKSKTKIPVVIFPGDETQISKLADAILILSLLSGRNPEYLIGKHVLAAEKIKRSKLPTIPTGYILVKGGAVSTTQKVTKTRSLITKKEIIQTALAGELLGKQLIYLEAGSGAKQNVNSSIIKAVKKEINIPLIVGGGINSFTKAKAIINAKPDYMVIGNALEKNINLLQELNSLFI